MDAATDFDGMLWNLAYRYSKTELRNQYTVEDLFSEARLVALKVIKKYKADKNSKISTYVYHCVENRLKDISRKIGRSPIEYHGDFRRYEKASEQSCEDLEFALMMKGLLTDKEYVFFQKIYVEDFSMKDLTTGPNRIANRREANKCLARIHQKYLSLEKSQTKILTQRARQERWLCRSPD